VLCCVVMCSAGLGCPVPSNGVLCRRCAVPLWPTVLCCPQLCCADGPSFSQHHPPASPRPPSRPCALPICTGPRPSRVAFHSYQHLPPTLPPRESDTPPALGPVPQWSFDGPFSGLRVRSFLGSPVVCFAVLGCGLLC
jgi:hypothetical protein